MSEQEPLRTPDPAEMSPYKELLQVKRDFAKVLQNNPLWEGIVNGVGIGIDREDKTSFNIAISLRRDLTPEEQELFPTEYEGMPIRYRVVGEIKPLTHPTYS